MVNLIKIELSEGDAKQFVLFQKHFAFIQLMESIKAFDIRSGSITIHFDNLGQIRSIDKNEHYKLPEVMHRSLA